MPFDTYALEITGPDDLQLTLTDRGVATPTSHASSHGAAGDDPITIASTQVTGLGTMASQAANSVTITGGSISGIVDLAVADGGTGASTLTGVAIGNGTSAFTAATSSTAGQVLRCTGANTFAFGAVDLADTDATTGSLIVSRGGTGATTLTGIAIGNGTSAITAATSSTAGQVLRCTGTNTFAFGAVDLDDTDAVTGTLAVANGGTNAATAAAARTNLGFGSGHATLVSGSVTVTDALSLTTSSIVVSHHTVGGPAGHLYVDNSTNGQFTINSTNAADANDVDYIIIY